MVRLFSHSTPTLILLLVAVCFQFPGSGVRLNAKFNKRRINKRIIFFILKCSFILHYLLRHTKLQNAWSAFVQRSKTVTTASISIQKAITKAQQFASNCFHKRENALPEEIPHGRRKRQLWLTSRKAIQKFFHLTEDFACRLEGEKCRFLLPNETAHNFETVCDSKLIIYHSTCKIIVSQHKTLALEDVWNFYY